MLAKKTDLQGYKNFVIILYHVITNAKGAECLLSYMHTNL